MNAEKKIILSYYKNFLKLAKGISFYNYRDYALRKIKHDFRTKSVMSVDQLKERYGELNRIVIVQNLYSERR